jgi:hypothetical protein
VKAHVPDDADDFKPRTGRPRISTRLPHAPADRVYRPKGMLRERRVDDDGAGVRAEIAGVEGAAGDERLPLLIDEVGCDPGRAHLEGARVR